MIVREHSVDQGVARSAVGGDLIFAKLGLQPEPCSFGDGRAAAVFVMAADLQPPRSEQLEGEARYAAHGLCYVAATLEATAAPQ